MNRFKSIALATTAASIALATASAADASVFVTSITLSNAQNTYLQVAEVQAFSGATNVALGATAIGSSYWDTAVSTADKAVDGNTGGDYYTDTIYHGLQNGGDLLTITFAGGVADISSLTVFGRTDTAFGSWGFRDVYNYTLYNGAKVVGTGQLDARNGSATATFAAAAVPEPATWALMLAGFGMIGFAARRSTKANVRVAYA